MAILPNYSSKRLKWISIAPELLFSMVKNFEIPLVRIKNNPLPKDAKLEGCYIETDKHTNACDIAGSKIIHLVFSSDEFDKLEDLQLIPDHGPIVFEDGEV